MPRSPLLILPGLAAALALASCERSTPTEVPGSPGVAAAHAPPVVSHVASKTVIGEGLLYPRGIAFGSDGSMYVAEAGTPQGNTTPVPGHCENVPAPVGPYLGGHTSRISRFDTHGARTTFVSDLPSSINAMGDVLGVNDVAFVGKQMYALLNAGCSHGNATVPASVIHIKANGTWSVVADLSAWLRANPTANPEPDDFEPDGTLYSMIASGGSLYAVESNQGSLISLRPDHGQADISRVADVSATEGHVVPTAVTVMRGSLLVTELTPFPAVPGASKLLSYQKDGRQGESMGHFTAVLGVDGDGHGNVFVLESFTCATAQPCFPSPGSADIVRISRNGTRDVVVTGLSFATALRVGPDGALYVSTGGFGPPASGQIVRITLAD